MVFSVCPFQTLLLPPMKQDFIAVQILQLYSVHLPLNILWDFIHLFGYVMEFNQTFGSELLGE